MIETTADKEKLMQFIVMHKKEFEAIQINLVELFNQLGQADSTGKMQLAFVGTMIATWMKTMDVPKSVKQDILSGVSMIL